MRVIVVVVEMGVIVGAVAGVSVGAVGGPVAMAGVVMVVMSVGMGVATLPAMFTGVIVRSVSPVLVRQFLPPGRCGAIPRSATRTVDEAHCNDNRWQLRSAGTRALGRICRSGLSRFLVPTVPTVPTKVDGLLSGPARLPYDPDGPQDRYMGKGCGHGRGGHDSGLEGTVAVNGSIVDPALVDRRSRSFRAIEEGDLPSRTMTIAGCEGRIEARILSKDLSGPATRLALIPAGWGSGVVGAFTADLELFVIRGELSVAGQRIGQYDYAAVRAGEVISGLRALADSLALVMTSAPIRYDTSAGGMLSEPLVGLSAAPPWSAVPELPGRFSKPLADGPAGPVWLSGAREWSNEDGPWHVHEAAEEVFVLEGEFTVAERLAAADEDGDGTDYREEIHRCGPGTYTFRLAGRSHAGPGSSSSDLAIAFHRMHGPRSVEWSEPDSPWR